LTFEDSEPGILADIVFCKKRLMKKRMENGHYKVVSEEAAPLCELLTSITPPRGTDILQQAWFTFDRELLAYTLRNKDNEPLASGLRALFLEYFPSVTPNRIVKINLPYDEEYVMAERYAVTPKAATQAENVKILITKTGCYYSQLSQKVHFMLCRGDLTIVGVMLGSESSSLVATESEAKRIRKTYCETRQAIVGVPRDEQIRNLLLN